MIDDLAAILECVDTMRKGGKEVWNRRQAPSPPQRHASSGAADCGATTAVSRLPISRDYIGLLVWSGQNLMCKAEEGGWRATMQLLEEALQVGSVNASWYIQGETRVESTFHLNPERAISLALLLWPKVLEHSIKPILSPVGASRAPYVPSGDPPQGLLTMARGGGRGIVLQDGGEAASPLNSCSSIAISFRCEIFALHLCCTSAAMLGRAGDIGFKYLVCQHLSGLYPFIANPYKICVLSDKICVLSDKSGPA